MRWFKPEHSLGCDKSKWETAAEIVLVAVFFGVMAWVLIGCAGYEYEGPRIRKHPSCQPCEKCQMCKPCVPVMVGL